MVSTTCAGERWGEDLPLRPRVRTDAGGFTLIELLLAMVVFGLATLVGSAYIARSARDAAWTQDRIFAQQKARAILAEIQAKTRTDDIARAADLDGLDDGDARVPTLSIATVPDEDVLVAPDHRISGNKMDQGAWRWSRSVSIEPYGTDGSLDRRLCVVRVFRHHPGDPDPDGNRVATATGVLQTFDDMHAAKQVFDLYVIAIENVPSFWTSADTLQTLVTAAVKDLQQRNLGLRFRVHWITKMGFGRDEEYAPHGNSTWRTTDPIWLSYYYPGRLPDGEVHRLSYPVNNMQGRFNLDAKENVPALRNGPSAPEIYYDTNGNGRLDGGEEYEDADGDNRWDPGNLHPYAMADMHNHAMRYPDALAKFEARVAAGNETEGAPTWRLLLDRMVAEPERYEHALILNTHGGLLPMPPVRNVSDPASSPETREGWRVVTHPEHLAPSRVRGDDAASVTPRFRVYAFKTAFDTDEVAMTLPEPFEDKDGSGDFSKDDNYKDLNDNGRYDEGLPITLVIPGGDMATGANVDGADGLVLKCLGGGVDADADGTPEPYDADWRVAPRLPEPFTDVNGNGRCEVAEPFFDLDGNGSYSAPEPYVDVNRDGVCNTVTEPFQDMKANGRHDPATPEEFYDDKNDNGRWDDAEPYWDYDGNGTWTKPSDERIPPDPWDSVAYGSHAATLAYIQLNGEPFLDLDGDGEWDEKAEPFVDGNANGRWDHGVERGDLYFTARYDAAEQRNVLMLYGTPLETPPDAAGRGLDPQWRLYDYEYVPSPTPAAADADDRFGRDLSTPGSTFPKNTARWTVEMPLATLRRAYESAPGGNDGDATDRILTVETRMGHDLATGVMWPVPEDPHTYVLPAWVVPDSRYEDGVVWPYPEDPQNRSATYAYFYADPEDVPFSERFQFQGDPRHSPYADTDARGSSFPHGYNWYFDDLHVDGYAAGEQPTALWGAYDWSRLASGWAGRADFDVPRYTQWLRTGLARTGATFTHLAGASFTWISLGGDIASLEDGKVVGVPVSGFPYASDNAKNVNTLGKTGSHETKGSRTYVRCNKVDESGLRDGGSWWAKPWLGELFPDRVYFEQWSWFGNLKAQDNTDDERFSHMLRKDAPEPQLPHGMKKLAPAWGDLGPLGVVSVFNKRGASGTLRQDHDHGGPGGVDDGNDVLMDDGVAVGEKYGFSLPTELPVAHPFGLELLTGDATEGLMDPPEWQHPALFPHWSLARATRYLANQTNSDTEMGSATVRMTDPTGVHHGRVILNGTARGLSGGDTELVRYALMSLLHSVGKEGLPGVPGRIPQLPLIDFDAPVHGARLIDPTKLTLRWSLRWHRWDDTKYNEAFADDFAEAENEIVYVISESKDFGENWRNLLDGSWSFEGELPRRSDGTPDPARTLRHVGQGSVQMLTWDLPRDEYPSGSYVVRVEAYRPSKSLHYAYRTELLVDVER